MEGFLTLLEHAVLPIIAVIISHYLNRRKFKTEVSRMESENEILVKKAKLEREKAEAENDRYVSDTALSAVDRLALRLETIEKRYDEIRAKLDRERQLHEAETEKLESEILVLKEQLKKTILEREAAQVKLTAAIELAKRYRLIAVDLYQQLLDESIVPRHVLETCNDIEEYL